MARITITAGDVRLPAELSGGATADAIAAALPIEGRAQRWGEEIWFGIPVEADLEPGATDQVEIGAIGYWPTGNAFCIFFGPTPASHESEPRAASPVTLVGRIEGDATLLRSVADGDRVRIEREGANG